MKPLAKKQKKHSVPIAVTIYSPHVHGSQPKAWDISLPKLLECRGNGLTFPLMGFASVVKSVSHPLIRSVRFVQVELCGARSAAFVSANR